MQNRYVAIAVAVVVVLVVGGTLSGRYLTGAKAGAGRGGGATSTPPSSTFSASTSANPRTDSTTSGAKIQVVAAENFWGSLVAQLGGVHVSVSSIVSDPNTDPHEYESNPANAVAISDARLVIVNGAGYDTWALNILSAESTQNQVVLNVQRLINQTNDANPHFWYSPYYVNDTVKAMYNDLLRIDPLDANYFHQQYANLNVSLWQSFMSREVEIRQQYAGAPVAATEDIFAYLANATGLEVVSPLPFMQAVAEGNEPPAQSVAQFQQLLQGGNSTVRVLVYNEQTVTPLTQSIKSQAAQYQIPTVAVTETIQPPDATFQTWMGAELIALQDALNAQALGR